MSRAQAATLTDLTQTLRGKYQQCGSGTSASNYLMRGMELEERVTRRWPSTTRMAFEDELSATELLGWAMLLMMWPRDAVLLHEPDCSDHGTLA